MKKIFITLLSVLFFLGCTLFQELIEPSDLVNLINDKKGDITPPVVIINSPSNYQEVGSNYQISGTVSDSGGSGVKAVYVKTDGGAYNPVALIVSNWTANLSLANYGFHTNYIYSEDNAGNKSVPIDIIVERTSAPSIIILAPANGSFTNISNITVSGISSVDSPYSITKVQVQVNGGGWTNASGTASWTSGIILTEGENTFKARAIADNDKTNESIAVIINYITQVKFIAYDGAADDLFGYSVSISADGNTFVVGSVQDDDKGGNSGSIYRFHWNGSFWETNKFVAYDGAIDDNFGFSIDVSSNGNTFVTSAIGDDDNFIATGSVYRFYWSGSEWKTNKLLAFDGTNADFLGRNDVTITADGNTIIACCYSHDIMGGVLGDSGAFYRFYWNGLEWETNEFIPLDKNTGDNFGVSAAITPDGNTIFTGAAKDNDGKGSVYRFYWNGSGWVTNEFFANDGMVNDEFGCSVAVSADGNTFITGAHYDDEKGNDSGSVYLFHYNGSFWVTNKFVPSDGAAVDNFGHSVSISADGNTFVAGAHNDDDKGNDSGSVYCFHWNGAGWETNKITAYDGAADDEFGASVSISADGKKIGVGANYNDDKGADSGSVYLIKW